MIFTILTFATYSLQLFEFQALYAFATCASVVPSGKDLVVDNPHVPTKRTTLAAEATIVHNKNANKNTFFIMK